MVEKCKKCVAHRSLVNVITSHKWPVEHLHPLYRLSHSPFYSFALFQSFFWAKQKFNLVANFCEWDSNGHSLRSLFVFYRLFHNSSIVLISLIYFGLFSILFNPKHLYFFSKLLFANIFQWLFFFIEKVYKNFFFLS